MQFKRDCQTHIYAVFLILLTRDVRYYVRLFYIRTFMKHACTSRRANFRVLNSLLRRREVDENGTIVLDYVID